VQASEQPGDASWENLDQFVADLDTGAVVVIGVDRVRVRRLSIE
jgi:hypothetical protein